MKKIKGKSMPFLFLIFLFFPLYGFAEELPPLAVKAEKLYNIDDYNNSIMLFEECYNDSHNPVCISQPLIMLDKAYATLPKISKHSLTRFTPEKTQKSWKDFFKNQIMGSILPNIASNLITGSTDMLVIPIDNYSSIYRFMTETSLAGPPIQIANPESVKKSPHPSLFLKYGRKS